MKKTINIKQGRLMLGLLLLVVLSCNKKWDDHYAAPAYVRNGSVYAWLLNNPDYSQFVRLLKKTGYDSLLTTNGSFTVFAVKNGNFIGVDTTNIAGLKKIISMHIVSSALYTDGMNNTHILAVSGKLLKFSTAQSGLMVNGISLKGLNARALNGVIQEVSKPIIPAASLYDVIIATPALSLFKTYIDSSFQQVIDLDKNIRIGYDTANQPVYQEPIIYKQLSNYLANTAINDENVVRTVFMPTNTAVNKAFSNLLAARAGRQDLIIPRLPVPHHDTTIGYTFIPSWVSYRGDSTILMDSLFTQPVIGQEIPALSNPTNTFTNILGNPFTVSQSQLQTNATPASNGIYYLLNDITLPDLDYRSQFMFLPFPKVQNPANPSGPTIVNPNLSYSGGASTSPSQSSNSTCYTGKYTRFSLNQVGGEVDFNFPFATKGYYKVVLNNYLDNNGCIISANFGSQQLKQNFNTSTLYAVGSVMVNVDLGTINVTSNGPVKISFTCTGVSPKTALKYEFCVDLVQLIPVQGP
jgi:uncharacterized surface protein with fasciclin (FAS1) repeats